METETTTKETLILSGQGYGLSIAPAAETLKKELIASAEKIVSVTDTQSAESAREQLKLLAKMRIAVEASRVAVKEPVLTVGKTIDTMAKEFSDDIIAHEQRLSGLISSHAEEVERQRVAAEKERQRLAREAEDARLAAERQREEQETKARLAAEASEKARKEAEDALWNAETPEQKLEADRKAAEAEQAKRDAEQRQREAQELEAARRQEATTTNNSLLSAGMMASAPAPAGVSWVYDYEVTDVHELYKHSPLLVDVTPRRSAILDTIKELAKHDGAPAIAGLKITKKPRVSGR